LNLLALDTTGISGSIALLQDGRPLVENSWRADKSHASELPCQTLQICREAQIPLSHIDAYAVTLGPGSFTGIRIGLAFVKGLALISQKTVVGVSTLRALALGVDEEGLISPWIDARRGEIYGALFEKRGGELITLLEARALSPELFLGEITQKMKPSSILHFLGNGALFYQEKILERSDFKPLFLNEKSQEVKAGIVGREAYRLLKKGEGSKGGIDLYPQYLRASEAELKIQGSEKPDLTGAQ